MGRSTLNTHNSLYRLFTEDRETKSLCNMREFLLFGPFNIILSSLIVIIVISSRLVLKGLSIVDLLGLTEPCAGWFPPSVVELKEHVVEVRVLITNRLNLVEALRDIANLVEVLRSHLTDVKVDQMAVEAVNFEHFILCQAFGINPVLNMNMLVRESN